MSFTLSTMQTRITTAFGETVTPVWDPAMIIEAIRLALGDYMIAAHETHTIAGLDDATETTVDPHNESLLVVGAMGYAALTRAIERAESFEMGSQAANLKAWGEMMLFNFYHVLKEVFPPESFAAADIAEIEKVRLASLRNSSNPPWIRWIYPKDEILIGEYDL